MTNSFGSDVPNRLAEDNAGGWKFIEQIAVIWWEVASVLIKKDAVGEKKAIVCKPDCIIWCELCELFNFFPLCTYITLAFLNHIWSSGCFNIQGLLTYSKLFSGYLTGTKFSSVHASLGQGFLIGNQLTCRLTVTIGD